MPSPPETPLLKARSAPCLSETPGNGNEESGEVPVSGVSSTTSTASTRARGQTATIEDFQCPICMDTFINVRTLHKYICHCILALFNISMPVKPRSAKQTALTDFVIIASELGSTSVGPRFAHLVDQKSMKCAGYQRWKPGSSVL